MERRRNLHPRRRLHSVFEYIVVYCDMAVGQNVRPWLINNTEKIRKKRTEHRDTKRSPGGSKRRDARDMVHLTLDGRDMVMKRPERKMSDSNGPNGTAHMEVNAPLKFILKPSNMIQCLYISYIYIYMYKYSSPMDVDIDPKGVSNQC